MTKKLLLIAFILLSVSIFAQAPTLSNFNVEDSFNNRLYFDSSEPISASSVGGFYLGDGTKHRITGVSINTGQNTGHYFTVSAPFTFWDNYALRYEGGSNFQDGDSKALIPFTLSYVKNNMPEPEASIDRYVTTSATGGGDGLTEATAWMFQEAFNNATAGQTVWIKAGDYGNLNLNISSKNGTISSPIKFVGYKSSIGDITNNYYDNYPNVTWSASEMPTLTGSSPVVGLGIYLSNSNYIVFRNIQITKYYKGLRTPNKNSWNSNVVFDNMNFKEFGAKGYNSGVALGVYTYNNAVTRYVGNTNFKFLNLIMQNYSMGAIHSLGDGINLMKNVKTYNDFNERADYQITLSGNSNIVTNCRVENVNNTDNRSTHGIGIRGDIRRDSDYNLIADNEAINLNEGFYIRNFGCEYNVIKDCISRNNSAPTSGSSGAYRGGVYLWGGVNYNIIERVTVDDAVVGIGFKDNEGEDGIYDKSIGHDNIIRNCTFNNVSQAISVSTVLGGVGTLIDNKIVNCTFNDVKWLFGLYNTTITNLEITNCTFSNVGTLAWNSGAINYQQPDYSQIKIDHTNFWNLGFTTPTGTNILEVDPKFMNAGLKNFQLQPDSSLRDAGIDDNDVRYDISKMERASGKYSIGAFDDEIPTVGSVSSDSEICSGESATLVASGGTSYLWNSGETSATITVSPATTTTYTVTVTDGSGNSDSHEVVVTVDEAPTVDVGVDQSICFGESVTLTATGVGNFLWNTGETTASITINPTTTTTYSVTASNSCATDATDEIVINVNPEIGLTVGDDISICVGETTTLTATGNGDFLWNTGETTPSITVQPNSTTTYSVTSTLGDCNENDSVLVTVSEAPSVDLGLDQSICYGETVTLTATGAGDFLWNTGETTASITVSPTTTTTYSVTASNSCATEATDDIIINVNPEIGLTVGNDINICVGETTTLTATGNGDFLWNTGETTASITVNPSTTTTYSVVSSIGTCTENGSIEVAVNEQPSVNLGSDQSICYGESVILTATGTGDFLWNTGETTASITVNPTTTTTYSVTASNSCATDATDEIIINVNPEIGLSVGNDIIICVGETTTLTATGNGDFLWNTGETTSSITVQPNSTTTYSVASSIGTCTENASIVVTVNESPSVDLGPDQSICYGETITLTANGAGDFLWSTGDTTASITVNPTITTTYSVTASNACTDAITDDIVINVNAEIGLTVGNDISICVGESSTLTATGNGDFLWNTGETTSSITVQPNSTTTYTVTSSLGTCSENESVLVTVGEVPSVDLGVDQSICLGESITLTATGAGNFLWSTGETTSSITVNPTSTTIYNVTASNGCNESVSDDVTVVINDIPEVNAGSDITIANGTTTVLTATGQGDFLWSTGETTTSISVNPTNTTTYTVTLTSSEGCSSTDNIEVTVQASNTEVNADAGPDRNICPDFPDTTLTANGGDSYLWSTGETTKSISVKPTVTTVYIVEVFKDNMSSSDDVTVFIDEQCNNVLDQEVLVYPNPTEGLLNISVPDFSEKMNISIFNLNGQIVYARSFDKTSNGQLSHQINLSRFGKGVYIVRFSNRYQSSSKKVLVI